jgi:hypothetical protein
MPGREGTTAQALQSAQDSDEWPYPEKWKRFSYPT